MTRISSGIGLSLLITVLTSITTVSPAAAQDDCAPIGIVSFVCGPVNAEDLVSVPGTDWILASAMAPETAFYLIDATTGAWSVPAIQVDHDTTTFPNCPAPPDMAHFESHGLNVRAQSATSALLYSVVHGGRESIEIFHVDSSGNSPALTWRGCVLMPDGLPANSVASFADGSIVATILIMPGKTFADSVAMRPTGSVVKWSPGDEGFIFLGNSELPGNNGIEVSADSSEIYVVSSGFQTVVAYSNTNPLRQLRSTPQLPITPDNIHFDADGRLLTAGMKNDVPECGGAPGPEHDLATLGTCPRGTIAIAIDPAAMAMEILLETDAFEEFSNGTMVLLTGERYWIGTFSGDRIAYGDLP